jgi:hypothetical protein
MTSMEHIGWNGLSAADDYDQMMAERTALQAAQKRATQEASLSQVADQTQAKPQPSLYEGLGLIDGARTRRSQSRKLASGAIGSVSPRYRKAK